jgi:hypothetical protein
LRRMGSIPRANRTETAPAPVRSRPALAAERTRLAAAEPVRAARPNPAARAVAVPAARRETHRAAHGAVAARRAAVPKRAEPVVGQSLRRPVAEGAVLPARRVPAGPALRTKDRTCWWAGSELHSERRRSLRQTPGREHAPTKGRGRPAQHTRLCAPGNRERPKNRVFPLDTLEAAPGELGKSAPVRPPTLN